MIEFVLVSVFGLVVGILIGLMPMMPIYLGSFLMYFFLFDWQLQSLLIFWIATLIGSQFFGSVAAITLGIPGESSSVVYVNQVRKLPLNQRAKLLWKTARGSHIAGFTAIVLVWLILTQFTGLHYLGNHWLKLFFYTFAILVFMFMDRRPWVALLLIMFGLFLSPGNNLVLPEWYYKLQFVFQDITFSLPVSSFKSVRADVSCRPTVWSSTATLPLGLQGLHLECCAPPGRSSSRSRITSLKQIGNSPSIIL